MSTDIILPKEQEPMFPDQCCRCLADHPNHRVRFSASRFSWGQVFFFWVWLFRKSVKHEVPVCDGCHGHVRWRKRIDLLILIVIAGLAMLIMIPLVKSMGLSRQWQHLATLGGALLLLLPYLWWVVMRPPPFDMTVTADHIEYEFASNAYARAFASCNANAKSDDIFVPNDFDDADDDDDDGDHDHGPR